jgi:branched-subunit amino acid aminotransferase/4-amino-4-deoxychorismate lyase
MNFALAEFEAGDVDPDAWPILTDAKGNITEGTTNSVFLVADCVIRTSGDRSIVQGGSRIMVLDLARQLDMRVAEEDLQPCDRYTSDDVFFSRTGPLSAANDQER